MLGATSVPPLQRLLGLPKERSHPLQHTRNFQISALLHSRYTWMVAGQPGGRCQGSCGCCRNPWLPAGLRGNP